MKLSQLDLATEAGVSARHLSFVETGRSQPSREMLLTIAGHLDSRVRDGRVVENRIFVDRAEFEPKLGISLQ